MSADDSDEEKKRLKKERKKLKKDKKRKKDDEKEEADSSNDEEVAEPANEAADEANNRGDDEQKQEINENEGGDENQDDNQDDNQDENDDGKPKRKRKRKRKSKATSDTPEEGKEESKKLTSIEHTVYVEGIPFDCTEEEVRDFFVSNGIEDILQLRLPRWQDSGRLRGYGHAVFESEASRSKAVKELSGKNLKRRYLTIQEAKAPRPDTSMGVISSSGNSKPRTQPVGCKTVFIKNLPYHATEEDILDVFRVCGKVVVDGGVRIARNYENRQSKGFAYVEFKNPEGAFGAVQKASKGDMKVLGRPCFVDYDEGSMKGSFKTKDGRMWSREHKPSRDSTSGNKNKK